MAAAGTHAGGVGSATGSLNPDEVFQTHSTLRMQLGTLRVAELTQICRGAGTWAPTHLRTGGKKAEIIDRIFAEADKLSRNRTPDNVAAYKRFKDILTSKKNLASSQYRYGPHGSYNGAQNPNVLGATPGAVVDGFGTVHLNKVGMGPNWSHPAYGGSASSLGGAGHSAYGTNTSSSFAPANGSNGPSAVSFFLKPSPFYHIRKYIGAPARCQKSPYERKLVRLEFSVDQEELKTLHGSTATHQIRLVCVPWDNHLAGSASSPTAVEFPTNADVRVNGKPLGVNLRGSKKAPGKVPAPDLTEKLWQNQGMKNIIEFSYHGAIRDYVAAIAYVEKVTIDALVESLDKKILSKETVLKSLKKKAADDDVVSGAATVSLKCPLSLRKLDRPARSSKCDHVQCFDPKYFLLSNEQAPTWACPVCANVIKWEDVIIDGFMKDIVSNVGKDVETVIVEPDGEWRLPGGPAGGTKNSTPVRKTRDSAITLEKDLSRNHTPVEVFALDDSPAQPNRGTTLNGDSGKDGTSGRDWSAGGSSRMTSEEGVIDLTLDSDDEDDSPPIPPRRSPHKRPAPNLSPDREPGAKRAHRSDSDSSTHGNSTSQPSHRSERLADGSELSPDTMDRFFSGESSLD